MEVKVGWELMILKRFKFEIWNEGVQKVKNRCHSEEERRRELNEVNLLIINLKWLTSLSLHFSCCGSFTSCLPVYPPIGGQARRSEWRFQTFLDSPFYYFTISQIYQGLLPTNHSILFFYSYWKGFWKFFMLSCRKTYA